MDSLINFLSNVWPIVAAIVFLSLLGTVAASLFRLFFRVLSGPIPVSHKIAVIGLPGAGKTTLITALFEMIQRGTHVNRVHLHGMQTIKTVNKYVAALNSHEKIGPTKAKDIFVFRFSYIKRSGLLRRLYDVEIADFPGEYSQRISDTPSDDGHKDEDDSGLDFEYTLFNKEFFSWIGSSREYLFLVDLSSIYSVKNVRRAVADITARIRTSWQVIEDAVSERGIGTKTDSVLGVEETKASLVELFNSSEEDASSANVPPDRDVQTIKDRIRSVGETNNLTMSDIERGISLEALVDSNSYVFSDLISFFQSRRGRFDIIYCSMTIKDSKGERLGVRKVLQACLP